MQEKGGFSGFLLFAKQIGDLYAAALADAAGAVGLTKQEADVLLFLANNPELDTASDVAKYRGFSRAYVSKAVEALLGRSLIEVSVAREDRRVQRLLLAPSAREKAASLQRAQTAFFARMTQGVPQEELSVCAAVLEHMMRNADRIASP